MTWRRPILRPGAPATCGTLRRDRLTSGPASALVRAYLDLSIACRRDGIGRIALDGAARDAATAAALQAFPNVPLLQYRAGLCGGAEVQQLEAVSAADAEFVDADLELGRRALQNRVPPDITEGVKRLQSARLAFPTSPVPPIVLGNLHEGREEWPEALADYDAALEILPAHRDALVGRTVKSFESRSLRGGTGVCDPASRAWGRDPPRRRITGGAWNLYQLDRIQDARVDADRAKALMVNPALFVLSGMIDWREKRLETADADFVRAIEMDFGQCQAAFYLANVRWERRLWRESIAAFLHARQCFDLAIVTRSEAIAGLSSTPEETALNAAMIASHRRAIQEAEMRRGQAAQNIAALQKFIDPAEAR